MWIKKNWNEPVTVGGYVKMCIWSFIASFIIGVGYVLYYGFKRLCWGDFIKEKFTRVKSKIRKG